jgi:hypothetical protein
VVAVKQSRLLENYRNDPRASSTATAERAKNAGGVQKAGFCVQHQTAIFIDQNQL